MPRYTFSLKYDLPLSNEHYTAIGEVAATWQYLELSVQTAIWAALDLDSERGRFATASLRFDTNLDIIGLLAPDDTGELIKATKALQGERNTVVHGIWISSPLQVGTLGTPMDLVRLAAWKLKMKDANAPPARFTPEQISAIAQRIHETRLKWNDCASALHASRQKSAPQDQAPTLPPS